jgi:SAM-dependent methyltransferase
MQRATDYPDYVARFYDTIYSQLRTIDRDYFLRKILDTDGPVLEIGVGTGRLFLEALNRGADIDGIDDSASMMAELKRKLEPGQHGRIFLQDARTMKLGRPYRLIVAPFRVFSHLIDVEDQLAVLNGVHGHLEAGGFFIFDLYVPDLSILLNGIKRHVDFDGEYAPGKKLRRVVSATSDLINQISHVTMTYSWDENGGVRSETWNLEMRFYFRHELEHLVKRSKLKLRSIFGDYQEGELRAESKDFVIMCERDD